MFPAGATVIKGGIDMDENKGFLHTIFHGESTVVKFNPSSFKLEDIAVWINKIREQDENRRKILDKEYTPLEEIKLVDLESEIGKYGENIPNWLFVKVNWYGRYIDYPAAALLTLFRQMRDEAETMFKNQKQSGI